MRLLNNKTLLFFLVFHFFVWSLLPLMRTSLPMDSIEAISWGWLCSFGTNKHPPLSGHLAYWFYMFLDQSPFAIYVLSQLCVLMGFVYIFKLANRFVDDEKAALSVMLLEGVIYYGYSASEFNVNVVSLALWPATVYYFYRAVVKGKNMDWVLTGLFAGLNLLNKYVSAVLLLCMFFFMLFDAKARKRLKEFGPYLAAGVGVFLVLPHVIWLYAHDFFSLSYFIDRSSQAGFEQMPFLRHVIYPLKFLGAQILFGLGALLIYAFGLRKAPRCLRYVGMFERHFLFWLGLMPVLVMTLVSFIGGIKLKSMWGFPALYMLGIGLMAYSSRLLTEAARRQMVYATYFMMFLMASAFGATVYFNKGDKMHLHPQEYAYQMKNVWAAQTKNKPLKYVLGDVWWANNVALFAPMHPKPVIWGDPSRNPWINPEDLEAHGGLVVTSDLSMYDSIQKRLLHVSEPLPMEVIIRSPSGKVKFKTIYYGIYQGLGEK